MKPMAYSPKWRIQCTGTNPCKIVLMVAIALLMAGLSNFWLPVMHVAAQSQPTPDADENSSPPRNVGWQQLGGSRLPAGLHRTSHGGGKGAGDSVSCEHDDTSGWQIWASVDRTLGSVLLPDTVLAPWMEWKVTAVPCSEVVDPSTQIYLIAPSGTLYSVDAFPSYEGVNYSTNLTYPFEQGIYTFTIASSTRIESIEFAVHHASSTESLLWLEAYDENTGIPRNKFSPGETIGITYHLTPGASESDQEILVELRRAPFGQVVDAWEIEATGTEHVTESLAIPESISGAYFMTLQPGHAPTCNDIDYDTFQGESIARWDSCIFHRIIIDPRVSRPQLAQVGETVTSRLATTGGAPPNNNLYEQDPDPATGVRGTLHYDIAAQGGQVLRIESFARTRLPFRGLLLTLRNQDGVLVDSARWYPDSPYDPYDAWRQNNLHDVEGVQLDYYVPESGNYLLVVDYELIASCPECSISVSLDETSLDETGAVDEQAVPTLDRLGIVHTSITCTVTVTTLNLRPGPGTQYSPVLAKLARDTELFARQANEDRTWLAVDTWDTENNLVQGWVSADEAYVSCNEDPTRLPIRPFDLTPQQVRANLLFIRGLNLVDSDLEDALAAFREARQVDPEALGDPQQFVNRLVARQLWNQGLTLAQTQELTAAVEALQAAAELDPALAGEPEQMAKNVAAESLILNLYTSAGIIYPPETFGTDIFLEAEEVEAIYTQAAEWAPMLGIRPREDTAWLLARNRYEYAKTITRWAWWEGPDWEEQAQAAFDNATALLDEAISLDPNLAIDPATEASRWTAEGLITSIHRAEDYPTAAAMLEMAQDFHAQVDISADTLLRLCRLGSLTGYAAEVVDTFCETAVELSGESPFFKDGRGLARALTGDVEGAVEDFASYVAQVDGLEYQPDEVEQMRSWIEALSAGVPPEDIFDEDTLAALRSELLNFQP